MPIEELFKDFYEKYEQPQVDELTVGFSGIDPELKAGAGRNDHERLTNLLGGDSTGHYHLTEAQIEKLIQKLGERYPPRIRAGQTITINAEEEMPPYQTGAENNG